MRLHGKVIEILPKDRVVKLRTSVQVYYLYFQRKDFKEFGSYFFEKPYLFVEVSEDRKRIELRSPDSMCNPYLAFALIIWAALYGIKKKISESKGNKLPVNLAEAKLITSKDKFIKKYLPQKIIDIYCK